MSKQKLIIFLTVLIDVLGFGIVIPILPFYVEEHGASAIVVTLLFSSFSFFSFLSSPFLGGLSDRKGRRPVIIYSNAVMTIGWMVFAAAQSIPMLFLGRIINGSAAGNIVTAQSYLVDISKDEKDRTANLGLFGAAFGVGFALGPIIGGALHHISPSLPFWIAAFLSGVNALSAYLFLPETDHQKSVIPLQFNPLKPLHHAIHDTVLRHYFLQWLFFSLAFVITQSVFALYAEKVFQFDSLKTGTLFTIIGVVVIINQTVLLKQVWTKFFTDAQLTSMMAVILGIGILMMGSQNLQLFYLSLIFLGTGQAIIRVVLTSLVAGHSAPHEKGEKLGILSAIVSACMVIAPVIGGALFEINASLPYYAGAAFLGIASLITSGNGHNHHLKS